MVFRKNMLQLPLQNEVGNIDLIKADPCFILKNYTKMNYPKYYSTFTPENEPEKDKTCPSCKELLSITKFKSKKIVRNGVSGVSRNYKCRKCEEIKSEDRKHSWTTKVEKDVESLKTDFDAMKKELNEIIKSMKHEISKVKKENSKLKSKLDQLSKKEKKSIFNDDSSETSDEE